MFQVIMRTLMNLGVDEDGSGPGATALGEPVGAEWG